MARSIPLLDVHRGLGGNVGSFSGWLTVIDYGSIVEEHLAVRRSVGFFDLSHMGRVFIRGRDGFRLLDFLVPRRIERLTGVMQGPTAFLNEGGGFIDDVMLYGIEDDLWLVVPNAMNIDRDREWLGEWAGRLGLDVSVVDNTSDTVMFAVQGPLSARLMSMLGVSRDVLDLPLLRFKRNVRLEEAGAEAFLVSRSGWTGEDGFEIITDVGNGEKILLKAAELLPGLGGRLCGLGARDTLRMEVGFVLYGHEIDEETSPVDARYWWVYQPGPKEECVGCGALRDAIRRGARRVRVGVKLGRGARIVPRPGDKIYVDDVEVGVVTSGAYSPVLKRGVAQAYVKPSHALMGMSVEVERRGRRYRARIVDFPLVTPTSRPPS